MERKFSKNPNPEMVTLARELRGVSQTELAEESGMKQPRIARLEIGHGAEITSEEMSRIADALALPVEFFYQAEHRIGFGTSALYTRARTLNAGERKSISSAVNIRRMHLKKMLDFVDISASRRLPRMSVAEYGSAGTVAIALRAAWNLPSGPIKNITKLIEGAGVIIAETDFHGAPVDATSVVVADMPPCIFINNNVPGDRWRFTLAHELAHLVMHDAPFPTMEDEADEFAYEFLTPSAELATMLSSIDCTKIKNLVVLKEMWGVSIASLIMSAERLGKMTANQKKWLFIQMNKLGIRTSEPAPMPREKTSVLDLMIGYFRDTLGFSAEDFANVIIYRPERLKEFYDYSPRTNRPSLRVV